MELFRAAGLSGPLWPVQLIGCAIVVALVMLHFRDWSERKVRLQFLAFVLVFCVIFNHRAERQSAVIAVAGLVTWYLVSTPSAWRTALFVTVYFLVAISGSDFVPGAIKHILVSPLRFSIPLTILWLVMLAELSIMRNDRHPIAEVGENYAAPH